MFVCVLGFTLAAVGQWRFYHPEAKTGAPQQLERKDPQDILYQSAQLRELTLQPMENRDGELVFSISLEDFIDSYNGYYWADHQVRYLLPPSGWTCLTYETGIHSDYETYCYRFSADETAWSLPTIWAYVPTNAHYLQEITVNFDAHSYTDATYTLYQEMCAYTLQVVFPSLSRDEITALHARMVEQGTGQPLDSDAWYGRGAVPGAVFWKDGVGVYLYSAIGDLDRLCIIPITQDTLDAFAQDGAQIIPIQ